MTKEKEKEKECADEWIRLCVLQFTVPSHLYWTLIVKFSKYDTRYILFMIEEAALDMMQTRTRKKDS